MEILNRVYYNILYKQFKITINLKEKQKLDWDFPNKWNSMKKKKLYFILYFSLTNYNLTTDITFRMIKRSLDYFQKVQGQPSIALNLSLWLFRI